MPAPTTMRQPSRSTGISVFYITIGVLMTIWSAVWYYFLSQRENPPGDWKYFVCTGLFLSGLALMIIGVLIGRIGREAQNADVPVGEVTAATVKPQGAAAPAASPPAVAPTATPVAPAPAAPAAPPNTPATTTGS